MKYAVIQGILCSILITLLGILISGIKGNYGDDDRETIKKVVKWVPIVLHVLQGAVACFWTIDALFPLLDYAITVVEQGIIAFIERHLLLIVLIGLIVWFLFFRKPAERPVIGGTLEKPSERDYFRALDTLRPAAAQIAGALGFASIDTFTDMLPKAEDRIKQWGRCWLIVYKIPKANASVEIDKPMVKRVLEEQMDAVVQGDNPSGYAELCFPWHGVDKPILLVHDVIDRDIYVYVFIVKASREYFEDKEAADERKSREDGSTPGTLYDD